MATTVWITVYVLLCAVNIVRASEKVVVEVAEKVSFSFLMKTVTRMATGDVCSVKTPARDEPYRLDPLVLGDNPDVRIRYYTNTSSKVGCGVTVSNADAQMDTGDWRIYVTNATGNFSEDFVVRVVVTTRNVIPKTAVTVVEGQDMYLRFEDFTVSNLIECRANWSQREVVLRPGSDVDPLVAYWGTDLTKDCGLRATGIKITDAGQWTLRASNTTGHVIEGGFDVSVQTNSSQNDVEKIFIAGDMETLYLGPNNSRYCQARRPNGQLDELKKSGCSINLGKVTKAHEGDWTARFAVDGLVDELQTTVTVRVTDRETIQATLKPSTKTPKALDLLCRWTTFEFASIDVVYCRFIRPDGLAMSLQDGVGNTNYSYYGDGINFSYSVKDCGVTIRNPKQHDVGTWQCLIGVGYLNMLKGGFINVPSSAAALAVKRVAPQSSDNIRVSGGEDDVIIQDQAELTLGCKATASLNYCWFGHPNGTALTPPGTATDSRRGSKSYSYSGKGLDVGDCSMTVMTASFKDAGMWSCNMGVYGGVDLKVHITVRVAEGNIAAQKREIDYTNSDSSAFISCHSIPKGVALKYCRFVRPDGVSFGFTTNSAVVMGRYRYSGEGLERGVCGLKIDTVSSEDFGQWTCAALHVAHTIEGKASITLTDQRELTGGAVAGIVIGTIAAVVLLGGVTFHFYKRR